MDLRDLESAPIKPELIISIDPNAYVKLRWTACLGVRNDRIFEDFQELLESVQGVEYVKLKRYSASLEVADHVVSSKDIVKVLKDTLEDYFEVIG